MADEVGRCVDAISNSIEVNSFVVAELVPLIISPSNEGDVVVDLTGDSEDEEVVIHGSHVSSVEHVETIDLTSPVRIVVEDIWDCERDGVIGPTREEDASPVAANRSNQQPPLHRHTSSNDDDVILVSSYHASPVPSNVKKECKLPSPLKPHLNHIIACPICLETQKNFSVLGHCLVATKCGHLFCDHCLKKSISLTHKCPTCSSKLTLRQYHRIYV